MLGRVAPAAGSDAVLVARCRAGDAAAWNELVERYSRYVYAICARGFRLAEHDAEDVFQDVFTRVYTHLEGLREDDAFRPWLAQLTRRPCIDHLRSSAREPPAAEVEAGGAAGGRPRPGGGRRLPGTRARGSRIGAGGGGHRAHSADPRRAARTLPVQLTRML